MFKRVEKRIKRKEEERELGIDDEVRDVLGLNDTDSEESVSESEDEGDMNVDGEDVSEEGEEEGSDDEWGGIGGAMDVDESEEEEEPTYATVMTISQVLKNPIYVDPSNSATHLCGVCPGKLLKTSLMIEEHTKSNAQKLATLASSLGKNAPLSEALQQLEHNNKSNKDKDSNKLSKRAEKKLAGAQLRKQKKEERKARWKEKQEKKAKKAAEAEAEQADDELSEMPSTLAASPATTKKDKSAKPAKEKERAKEKKEKPKPVPASASVPVSAPSKQRKPPKPAEPEQELQPTTKKRKKDRKKEEAPHTGTAAPAAPVSAAHKTGTGSKASPLPPQKKRKTSPTTTAAAITGGSSGANTLNAPINKPKPKASKPSKATLTPLTSHPGAAPLPPAGSDTSLSVPKSALTKPSEQPVAAAAAAPTADSAQLIKDIVKSATKRARLALHKAQPEPVSTPNSKEGKKQHQKKKKDASGVKK
ncbi:hypothetical protein AMATHDRAFT_45681 [Amanita thiersii Skay4041]|uniref:Uncharacterized protein n=1 Tax=Amanita thiersii Skay4041 TaxID=703135 RepID=A0A2A9NYS5_9AGAR|nr:hypothetical protein AMATHDRAFT_45681 [Amanita thiersii Skay4041]